MNRSNPASAVDGGIASQLHAGRGRPAATDSIRYLLLLNM